MVAGSQVHRIGLFFFFALSELVLFLICAALLSKHFDGIFDVHKYNLLKTMHKEKLDLEVKDFL